MPKYFEILGINPTLDMEEIKAGFIRKIVAFQPDIVGIDKEKRDEVLAAFHYLQDPIKLKEYYDSEIPAEIKEAEIKSASDIPSTPVVTQPSASAFACYAAELHYTKQIIIDHFVNESDFSKPFKVRWDKSHADNPCKIIRFHDDAADPKIDMTKYQSDDFVRIYIISGGRFIRDNDLFQKLVKLILPLVNHSRCVINLVISKAAAGNPSLAADFHESIFSVAKKDVPVVARTLALMLRPYSALYNASPLPPRKKTYTDFNKLVAKQPTSKNVFTIDEAGNQIKLDAYAFRWRKRIFTKLNQIHANAENDKVKSLLQDWMKILNGLSVEDFQSLVNCEINNSTSILKEHSTYSNMLFETNSVINRVYQLLEELKEIASANKIPEITKARIARIAR